MTNVAVEFYEAVGAPAGTAVPAPQRHSRLPLVAAGYWVLAAGLAAWAPFTRLYTVTFSGVPQTSQYTDGWGRTAVTGSDGGGVLGHAPRYGIALVTIAVLLALTAAAHLPPVARLRHARFVAAGARAASIAMPGLVVGVLLVLSVDLEAIVSSVNAAAADMTPGSGPTDGQVSLPHVHVGPCIWIATAALAAAVVAAVLAAVHRSRRPAPAPESATHAPVDHPVLLDMTDLEGIPGSETLD